MAESQIRPRQPAEEPLAGTTREGDLFALRDQVVSVAALVDEQGGAPLRVRQPRPDRFGCREPPVPAGTLARTVSDLFASEPPARLNEAQAEHVKLYTHLRTSEHCAEERAYVNERWSRFAALGLADPDFVSRFPVECGSRIWEIQLATTFADWGWTLMPTKKPGAGPDFGIRCSNGAVFWIEATAPTAGAEKVVGHRNPDKVRAPRGQVLRGGEIDRTVMLRYLSAIAQKREQHARAIAAGLVDQADGFGIAISGAMVPEAHFESEHEMPRIVRALFGVGNRVFTVPLDGGPVRYDRFADQESVAKSSGATIPARMFADASANEVGAGIFSGSYLKERPERNGHPAGHDYVFVLNPHAAQPFPFDAPPTGRVFYVGVQMDDRRHSRDQDETE